MRSALRIFTKFGAAVCVFMLHATRLGALELTKAGFSRNAAGGVWAPQSADAKGRSRADMEFSNLLTVRNIAFEKRAVVMPLTRYKDRTYADIKLLSKRIYERIEACFTRAECACETKPAVPVVKVEEVKPLKSKTRVANADVSFDGELKVTFGLVRNSSGELWVAYPSDFEVTDHALRNAISKAVKGAYSAPAKASR